MKRTLFFEGAKSAVPICLGLIPVGISYGLLALQAGFTQFETVLMSALVMAGSSQLMVAGMIGKATVLAMITAVFFVNLRHLVMSSAVMSRMEPAPLGIKLLSTFALCDESFALFSLSDRRSAAYLLGSNTALYGTWILASVLGVVIGQGLPEVVAKSFGVAFYALFIVSCFAAAKREEVLQDRPAGIADCRNEHGAAAFSARQLGGDPFYGDQRCDRDLFCGNGKQ